MKYLFYGWMAVALLLVACNSEPTAPAAAEVPTESAIAQLSTQIAAQPDDPRLYAARAQLYYEQDGYDEAISDLSKALQLDSVNVAYHHLLADVYMDYFRSQLALKTMERAAVLHPERIPTLLKLSEFQYVLKQYKASLATIDKVLRLNRQEPEAFFMMGQNFKELGDTARAINSFQEAVDLNPELTDAWINLGQLHTALKTRLAGRYFDTAIEVDSLNPVVYAAKGDYLRDQDRLPEAIDQYRAAARVDPQYEEAYFNAGLLYMELDSVETAYRNFDITIGVDPLHIRAYFFRGYAAELLGRTAEARRDYEHALRLAPDYTLPQEGLARLNQ